MLDKVLDKALEATVNAVLKRLFADYDADDMQFAIEKRISLLKVIEIGILDYHQRGDKWKPENKRRYKNFIRALKIALKFTTKMPSIVDSFVTVENTLGWMKENRPDLYEVINTEEGLDWLNLSLAQVKLLLKGQIQINDKLLDVSEVDEE